MVSDIKNHKIIWGISSVISFSFVLFCLINYWIEIKSYISKGWVTASPVDLNLAVVIPIALIYYVVLMIYIRYCFNFVSLFINNPIDWFVNPHINEDYKMPNNTEENITQVVRILRNRATRLRVQGTFILFLILFTLFGGLWLFQSAEELAPKVDNRRISQLKNRIDYYQMVIASPIIEEQKLIEDFAFSYLSNQEEFTKPLLNTINKIFPATTLTRNKGRKLTEHDIKELINSVKRPSIQVNNLKEYKLQLKETIGELKKDLQNEKIPPKDSGDANFTLVSLITTKFGVAVLLIFLVQILVTLYRYNARLASFYDARADALQIQFVNEDKMESIISLLAADSLEFTKAPSPLTHKIIDEIRSALATVNKKEQ